MTELLIRLAALDPVDASDARLDPGEWDEMFERIVGAPPTFVPATVRRTTRGRLGVAVTLLLLLGAIALLVATAGAGSRTIEVDAREALDDPARVERELARNGVEARIRTVPAKPFFVGKWFHLYLDPGAAVDKETFGLLQSYVGMIDIRIESVAERCPLGGCERTSILDLPASVNGPITLVVGRPPRAGEQYWARNIDWSNELAPHGALYCLRLEDRTPAEAEAAVRALGYDVIWVHEDAHSSTPVHEPPSDAGLTWAWFRDPTTLDFRTAAPDDAEEGRAAEGTPSLAHPRSTAAWAPEC